MARASPQGDGGPLSQPAPRRSSRLPPHPGGPDAMRTHLILALEAQAAAGWRRAPLIVLILGLEHNRWTAQAEHT